MTQRLVQFKEQISHFARREIVRREDLQSKDGFPWEIWKKMAKEGLLGLLLPASCGGMGASHVWAVAAMEVLASEGGSMGLAFSSAVHLLTSRVFFDFAGSRLADVSLEKLAGGEATASLAISEPGVGIHPRDLQTTAVHSGGFYILNGEKSYLTNGPIADWFIVLAVTGVEDNRKRYGAFVIPKGSKGLFVGDPMDLGFLRPSLHCGIRLQNCRVPEGNILGEKHCAYEAISLPFREREDVYLMGILCGGMKRHVEILLGAVREKGTSHGAELKESFGELDALVHALRLLVHEAGAMLDGGASSFDLQRLWLAFRSLARRYLVIQQQVVSTCALGAHAELRSQTNDLSRSLDIARSVIQLKQRKLGESLLAGKVF